MKLDILIIYGKGTNELLNRQSALGSYIFCLANLLQQEKYIIYINETEFSKIQSKSFTNQVKSLSSGNLRKLIPRFIKNLVRDKNLFKQHKSSLKKIMNLANVDTVIEFYTYGSELGMRASKKFNCPLLTVFDSPVLEEFIFFNGKKIIGNKRILRNQNNTLNASTKIVVYSAAVKSYVEKIIGLKNNILIHQNVDFTRFDFIEPRKIDEEINVGFIGSFLKWHRVDLLIRVFEKLIEDGIDSKLWLVGDGMEFGQIQELVNQSKCKNKIMMTGFCDGEKLIEIKNKLHIGVMPGSNWYGAPNKIFEYGAAGLAVVAPSTPTIQDLFGAEIILFEWNNEELAYQALYRLCKNHNLLYEYQFKLQQKIKEEYSIDETLRFYKNLIEF